MSSTNTLGKYQILREIARSNDIVYEATDPALDRRVAVKELNLPPNLTGAQKRERIERFLREGKAAGQLAHPNIVTIYDVGQEGDRFYIAMEFLEGQTLRDVLQMRGALPVKDAIDITLSLASALSYAHQHHVVHRDVKPENVQILPGGHVKLTDFGIARIMSEPSITADGQVFGTPSYMSPEQVSGKAIDGRTDVYSLGVLLYEMLAGQKPFAGDTVITITYNIMNSEPAPPPGVPQHLVSILQKAMAKDADLRYQTIDDFADALRSEPPSGNIFFSDPFQPATGTTMGRPVQSPSSYTTQTPPPTYSQGIPDPFAQPSSGSPSATTPPVHLPPPAPRVPILSGETKAFVGTLLLVLGLLGMLLVAIWATMQAYEAYAHRTLTELAEKHLVQGNKLMDEGRVDAAMKQYADAKRIAENAKPGSQARRNIAESYSKQAEHALRTGNANVIKQTADTMIQIDPSWSAGYYYRAIAYYNSNNPDYDAEFRRAIKTGGNDDYAQMARKDLSKIYIQIGKRLAEQGNPLEAKEYFRRVVNDKDIYDEESVESANQQLQSIP